MCRFTDKLTIVVSRGVNFTVSLSAEGSGTTIVSHPPLQPAVDLGPYFSRSILQQQFTLTNRWATHTCTCILCTVYKNLHVVHVQCMYKQLWKLKKFFFNLYIYNLSACTICIYIIMYALCVSEFILVYPKKEYIRTSQKY